MFLRSTGRFDHQQSKQGGSENADYNFGFDLAKNVFSLHGCDANGRPVLRKNLSRRQLQNFMANLPPCRTSKMNAGT
jgi:hypothetical protein